MTTSRIAGPVAVALAFVVAVLLAVLAADVVRSQHALERGDVRFAAVAGKKGMWTPETLLPGGVSRSFLGRCAQAGENGSRCTGHTLYVR